MEISQQKPRSYILPKGYEKDNFEINLVWCYSKSYWGEIKYVITFSST